MQLHFRPLLALALALLLGSHAVLAQGRPATPKAAAALRSQPETSAEELSAELFYEILVGEMAAGQGDMVNAMALMLEAARQSGGEQLYRRATELGLQSRSGRPHCRPRRNGSTPSPSRATPTAMCCNCCWH
jgi:hypothetical protein